MVYTDHKPLTFALASTTDHSPRQTSHLSFITEFTADIRHIKGVDNVVADSLSRPAVEHISLPYVDFEALTLAQPPIFELENSSL